MTYSCKSTHLWKRMIGSAVAMSVVAVLYSGELRAQTRDDFILDDVKKRYDFVAWAGKTKSDYTKLASAVKDVKLRDTPGTIDVKVTEDGGLAYGYRPTWRYLLSVKDGAEKTTTVSVTLTQGKNVMDAHKALIHCVAGSSAPTFRSGSAVGLNVGDVCFVGWGKGITGTTFCRNNILVQIRSMEKTFSVVDMAKFIDNAIVAASKE